LVERENQDFMTDNITKAINVVWFFLFNDYFCVLEFLSDEVVGVG